jgi:hypothetical protein
MMKKELPGSPIWVTTVPRGGLVDPRQLGDPMKLVLVEPAEERDSLQVSDPRIGEGSVAPA